MFISLVELTSYPWVSHPLFQGSIERICQPPKEEKEEEEKEEEEGSRELFLFHFGRPENFPPPPLLQLGPSCGIVALSLALFSFFEEEGNGNSAEVLAEISKKEARSPSLYELFTQALALSFSLDLTSFGEFFDCQELALLGSSLVKDSPLKERIVVSTAKNWSPFDLLKALWEGSLAIIPYEHDRQGDPITLTEEAKGSKAHYSLILGIIASKPVFEQLRASNSNFNS